MVDDEVTLVIRNDKLIIALAERLYQKHGHHKHKRNHIRQKLRQLGRFVIAARKNQSNFTNLTSCIDAAKFPEVVSVVRQMCGYASASNNFSNPSLALKLGNGLKKCAVILRSISLVEGNVDLKEQCNNFLYVCEADWQNFISSAAVATLSEKKWNKPHVLPLTEDLRRVTEHLAEERRTSLTELKKDPTTHAWHQLAKACLANLILFNRRRSGEAARMLISEYKEAMAHTTPNDDILQCLSPMEKALVERFRRVAIVGKRDRSVPVLLTKTACEEIDHLIAARKEAGVSDANEFVFARPYFSSEDHLAGHECLSKAAKESGAEQPENITSTRLRKHLATVSQVLNLTEHELEQVCGHMGHNIAVHREFYRLPDDTYQLAKVSRLLISLEQGNVSRFQGKTLGEIDIDLEIPDMEVEDDENEHVTGNLTECQETVTEKAETGEMIPETNFKTKQLPKKKETRKHIKKPAKSRDFLTMEQKSTISEHFRRHIDSFSVPKKRECEALIKSEESLAGKSWTKIKCTVRNEIEKRKRAIKLLRKN
jgi:hypothetical protein